MSSWSNPIVAHCIFLLKTNKLLLVHGRGAHPSNRFLICSSNIGTCGHVHNCEKIVRCVNWLACETVVHFSVYLCLCLGILRNAWMFSIVYPLSMPIVVYFTACPCLWLCILQHVHAYGCVFYSISTLLEKALLNCP